MAIEHDGDELADHFTGLARQLVAIRADHPLVSMADTLRTLSDAIGVAPVGEWNADIETRLRSLDVLSRELTEQLCGYLDITITEITEGPR